MKEIWKLMLEEINLLFSHGCVLKKDDKILNYFEQFLKEFTGWVKFLDIKEKMTRKFKLKYVSYYWSSNEIY